MARWDEPLKPFAELYAKLYDRIENMPEDELRKLLDVAQQATNTNCWFATYEVAQAMIPILRGTIARRVAAGIKRQQSIHRQAER